MHKVETRDGANIPLCVLYFVCPSPHTQARNSAALQLKLVPFGIVRAIVPPILDLGTLGLNLFTDPTRRQEALQTVELKVGRGGCA